MSEHEHELEPVAGDEPQPGDGEQPAAGDGEHGDGEQPPAEPSAKEIEQTYKRLDAEVARHVKRVAELVGEDAFRHLVACELCEPSMPGFRWPRPPDEQVKAAVRIAIGDRQPENWQADTYSRRCDSCQGLGEVLTGSQVRGQETLGCLECGSRGWIPIGPERGRPNVVQLATPPPLVDVEQPAAQPADDPPEVAALKAAGYVVIAPTRVE